MDRFNTNSPFTRRDALTMGAALATGLVASTTLPSAVFADSNGGKSSGLSQNVTQQIEQIVGVEGKTSNGVFTFSVDRKDIANVHVRGVPFSPAFQVNGDVFFQSANNGRAAMNGDLALKPKELDPFIHQLIQNDIVFQAQHQHLYNYDPMVWFIHFRAIGDPLKIAKGIKAALNVTSTPFPQTRPKNPTSPLPAKQMGEILGAKPSIGDNGVVNFNVPRAEHVRLGGMVVNPYLNIAAPIAFQPYGGDGNAVAVPDFAMIASEVNDVVGVMQKQGWEIGCLYNQETDEHPQLYFSHQFKTGNALQLAREIRNGLNRTNSKFE